ncbi:hypothetical protein OJF2_31560 [Aquisphaera giovannonii]|uniref:Uncharacterized protein n=1 Tax=Aquisphaera giovannonii TaxID=406548 RepID=A0A5B9W3H0_9BACT|nr:hypothetical protein [Aquisphaera giovannonii]QEH34615.1 hypothetical protein OJF2_31560 [Aquisphaera giovannonii]
MSPRNMAFATLIATAASFPSAVRADGGATIAVAAATYLKAEAANFAAQAANGWFVSYGPVVKDNGDFEMTFKNEIRYGPGGIGKETWWIDIKGNMAAGDYSVKGRGSNIVSWLDWYRKGMERRADNWQSEYKKLSRKQPSQPKRWVAEKAKTVVVSFKNDAPYGVDFRLNGSGPLSTVIHVDPRGSKRFNFDLAAGFKPYVRLRQPDGSWFDYRLLAESGDYRFFIDAKNDLGFVRVN